MKQGASTLLVMRLRIIKITKMDRSNLGLTEDGNYLWNK